MIIKNLLISIKLVTRLWNQELETQNEWYKPENGGSSTGICKILTRIMPGHIGKPEVAFRIKCHTWIVNTLNTTIRILWLAKKQIKIRKTLGELTPWKQLYNAGQETRIFDRWKDRPTWISQYTFGLGQPSGGWHVRRNGSPSATVKVFVGSSLKELSSAFLTNTELEVAMPHSFSAKHWYCPVK